MSTGDIQTLDKYKLLNCLASSQSSQIWEISEGDSSRHSAMKLLLPEAMMDPDRKAALKHEAKVGGSMQHPNILKYYETVVTKKHAYFVMEYFRAPNLKAQIGSDLTSVHVRIKRLIEQLAAALDHVHEKGWLHKDLKPDNILFSKGSELRLIDFSLSTRPTGALSKLMGGKGPIQGTRTYIAPEQILRRSLTPATDIYSLAITLFEVLTGKVPFKGTSPDDLLKRHLTEIPPAPSVFNNNVAPEMDRLILKMLSKKPDLRPRSMAEFMAEFRTVKIFKEAVQEVDKEQLKKMQEEELAKSIDKRIDSRADALRQAKLQTDAPTPVDPKPAAPATKPPAKSPAAASGAPPTNAPRPPGPPGQLPPGVRLPPGAPPAGMPRPPFPGGAVPPGMPPGMPRPPAPYPPGTMPPGGPWMPPSGVPLQPGQPYPPGMYPPQPGMPGAYPPPPGMPYPQGMPPMGVPRPPGVPPGMMPPGAPRPPIPGMPYPPGMQPPMPGAPGQPYPPGSVPPRPPQPPGPPPQR